MEKPTLPQAIKIIGQVRREIAYVKKVIENGDYLHDNQTICSMWLYTRNALNSRLKFLESAILGAKLIYPDAWAIYEKLELQNRKRDKYICGDWLYIRMEKQNKKLEKMRKWGARLDGYNRFYSNIPF